MASQTKKTMREDEEADIQDLEVGDLNDMESDASCHGAAVEDFLPFAIQNTPMSLCTSYDLYVETWVSRAQNQKECTEAYH